MRQNLDIDSINPHLTSTKVQPLPPETDTKQSCAIPTIENEDEGFF